MLTSERLMKAKELLVRDGWTINYLRRNMNYAYPGDMRRCALGCIYDVDGNVNYQQPMMIYPSSLPANLRAVEYLAASVPTDFHYGFRSPAAYRRQLTVFSQVAEYNNQQDDVAVILAWFDRAIELAEAAEMYRELESTKPVMDVVRGPSKEEGVNLSTTVLSSR